MTIPRTVPSGISGGLSRCFAIVALSALAGGCAQTGPLLTGVVTADSGPEGGYHDMRAEDIPRNLTVTRKGRVIAAQLPMALETGDELDSGANATAIIRFPEGHEVFVLPRSRVRVGSIFAYFGELIVRAKGLFSVETQFVTAGVEGTEFWVKLEKDQDAAVGVTEGRVRLSSKSGLWTPVLVKENDVYTLRGGEPPRFEKERMATEFRQKLRTIQRLILLPQRLPPRRY
ncbi:FecR domain-containing protein [Aromatoleum diolicum]|uniref:FecR protein domain-containing protein n=1 Tax=Aromatoleum diolicum TaxID=75796 RepID=A0ABX1QB60_9RHOO|nr:FecR domain-containing protein [Aromatoleum diolicum]NMG74261.1 hypothetical protein [Aromatoleum diolicum]